MKLAEVRKGVVYAYACTSDNMRSKNRMGERWPTTMRVRVTMIDKSDGAIYVVPVERRFARQVCYVLGRDPPSDGGSPQFVCTAQELLYAINQANTAKLYGGGARKVQLGD